MNAHTVHNTQGNNDALAMLLAPISNDAVQGHDLTYSSLFDKIREARRADDSALAQGAWQSDLKAADWRLVRTLCEQALCTQTKDLQLAAWYIEALTHLDGLNGLTLGLKLLHGLLTDYWMNCYPSIDGNDHSERAGRIEWLNHQLSVAIRLIAVTSNQFGGFTFLQWEESRQVDNLGLKDAKAKLEALADGKLSGEMIDKAIRQSGPVFYAELFSESQQALVALEQLSHLIEESFGEAAPSLRGLRKTLTDLSQLAGRFCNDSAGQLPAAASNTPTMPLTSPTTNNSDAVGRISSRIDAIHKLREVSHYFRIHEPHSPVALLAERAARWAEMPIEDWLAAVIKDQSTLEQLRELLDVQLSSSDIAS